MTRQALEALEKHLAGKHITTAKLAALIQDGYLTTSITPKGQTLLTKEGTTK